MGDDRGAAGARCRVAWVASWWPEDLAVTSRKCQLVAWGLGIFHEKFFGDTFADFLYGKNSMGLYVN